MKYKDFEVDPATIWAFIYILAVLAGHANEVNAFCRFV